ncbi:hypothetical protein ACWEQL_21690 [Kitasatospora sp. NPDC004240]
MIPIQRVSAPPRAQRLLTTWSIRVKTSGGTPKAAREEWSKARAAKSQLQGLLKQMAHGARRCMYCEDNLGTDIDHFQPINNAPHRAFDWPNHLLACSHCNSNGKRDSYPCDANGDCLLVDPSAENPAEHLRLLLASGTYKGLTDKGVTTIKVFGLNREDLVQGRQAAFVKARSVLRDWYLQLQTGDTEEAEAIAQALRLSPFAGVMQAMERLPAPVAQATLGTDAAAAIEVWRTHRM